MQPYILLHLLQWSALPSLALSSLSKLPLQPRLQPAPCCAEQSVPSHSEGTCATMAWIDFSLTQLDDHVLPSMQAQTLKAIVCRCDRPAEWRT